MTLILFLIAAAVILSWTPVRRWARAESVLTGLVVGSGLLTLLALGQAG